MSSTWDPSGARDWDGRSRHLDDAHQIVMAFAVLGSKMRRTMRAFNGLARAMRELEADYAAYKIGRYCRHLHREANRARTPRRPKGRRVNGRLVR